MADQVKFCYKCGRELPEGSEFCPECGSSIHSDGEPQRAEYTARPTAQSKGRDLGIIPVLMIVYGVFAIIVGILLIIFGMNLNHILDMLEDLAQQGGYESEIAAIRETLLATNFTFSAIMMLLSGIFAIISYTTASKMEKFQQTIAFCALASVMPLLTLDFLLAIIGFIITLIIYTRRQDFVS
jgi:hypothetical protein